MSRPSPTSALLEDASLPDPWERALLERQIERLDRLADMGMAIAGAIEQRVTAAEPGPAPDAALTHAALDFARVSRAVRMTFALQSRLIADFKGKPKPSAAAAGEEGYDGPPEIYWLGSDEPVPRSRIGEPAKVQDAVRRAAEDAGLEAETVERLVLEARERYEQDDIWRDLRTRPFSEVLARICMDLGLASDRDGLAGEGRRRAETVGGAAGSSVSDGLAGGSSSAAADPGQPAPHAASP